MDNITLTLGCVDAEKLDKLGIKLLSVLIDGSDMGRKVVINVNFIWLWKKYCYSKLC